MQDKSVEILPIDGVEYIIMDEDNDVIYTAELDNPSNILILKKEGNDLIKLDEIQKMPYYERFINKYGKISEE